MALSLRTPLQHRFYDHRPVLEAIPLGRFSKKEGRGKVGHQTFSEDKPLRKIEYCDPVTKKKLVFLTNNFAWVAETVAAVYKDRWEVELFFKALKQNLKIKRFYGNSRNAVMTQIWIALIAYLMYYILKAMHSDWKLSFTNFISVIKTMLFQRVSLHDWIQGVSPQKKTAATVPINYEFAW